ncbi:uncharacterized protein LOC143462538 isoform X2 [Clavelina lepadiformis]|uniref:uncharacterized protein LOC143462538 isoform X2 n=1 Tax=Clavelina lepadiformis TaxID=159417 RepID=UPI004042CF56
MFCDLTAREANVLVRLKHKNVVKVHGMTLWLNSLGIVMEIIEGENLEDFLIVQDPECVPWGLKMKFAEEMADGLSYLHHHDRRRAFVHGDLKPQNILLTCDLQLKIADFGSVTINLATGISKSSIEVAPTTQHTAFYAAPEFLDDPTIQRTCSMDVYSSALIEYEIMTQKQVFKGVHPHIILELIIRRGLKPDERILASVEKSLENRPDDLEIFHIIENVMRKSWDFDPQIRPDIRDVHATLNKAWTKLNKDQLNTDIEKLKPLTASMEEQIKCVKVGLDEFKAPFRNTKAPDIKHTAPAKEEEKVFSEKLTFRCPGLWRHISSAAWQSIKRHAEAMSNCNITHVIGPTHKKQSVLPHSSRKVGKIDVSVTCGDITNVTSDVIVNGVLPSFILKHGDISSTLIKKAGNEVQTQCNNNPFIKTKTLRITGVGKLSCKYIIHLVIPQSLLDYAENIRTVLEEAEKLHVTSVAFPALGTGLTRLSPERVARCVLRGIEMFSLHRVETTTIQKIALVIFKPSMLVHFWKPLVYFNDMRFHGLKDDGMDMKYNELSVSIREGDIFDDDSDVIVNGILEAYTTDFHFALGVLSNKLLHMAGEEIERQCNQNPIMKSKHLRVTDKGKVPWKFVIHLLIPEKIEVYVERMFHVLEIAEKLEVSSLALPAIGAGGVGLPVANVASSISEALEKFAKSKPKHVKRIRVVLFNPGHLSAFQANIIARKNVMTCGKRQRQIAESFLAAVTKEENILEVEVSSQSEENVKEAKEKVESLMNLYISKLVITDRVIPNFEDNDMIDIYFTAMKHQVVVSFSPRNTEIVLFGLSKNVNKLELFIKDVISEVKYAMALSRKHLWEWAIDFNTYSPLPLRTSLTMEQAFLNMRPYGKHVELFGCPLTVNVNSMEFRFCEVSGKLKRCSFARRTSDADRKTLSAGSFSPGENVKEKKALKSFSTRLRSNSPGMTGGSSPKFRPRSSGPPSEDEDIFKILLIGNSGVGKLALIYRFLYPDEPIFRLKFKSTVGLECETKWVKISGKTRQIQMWDIPGQKHFTSMTSYWFKGADGILLVYDVTDRQSFDDVPEHFVRIKQQADDDAKVILVGNKIDINDKRRVGKQEGLKFAKERGLKFFETSATGNINVADIFTILVADILKERTSYLLEGNREGHKTYGKAVNCHVM